MNSPVTASPRAERLLVEILCRRDEAAGHPLDSAAADLGAIRAGGDLAQRIRTRALRLPGSDQSLAQIDRVLLVGRALVVALLVIAAIAGVAAASVALGDGRDLSIPMVLLALVGLNLFMLLVWTAMQVTPLRAPEWLVMLWSGLVRAISGVTSASPSSAGVEAIRVLSQGPGARWRFGAVLHGAWLAYTVAGLLTLVVLLVVRRYELTWQTTLLSAEGLRELAELLSVVPRLLGASGPEQLSLSGITSIEDHRGWARWLLLAVLVYGVVPRLIALIACMALALRTEPRWQRELARPGYARLRDRLMPDHREQVVVDAAAPASISTARPEATTELPSEAGLHGVMLEWPDALPGWPSSTWRWFGTADDLESRAAVLARLRAGPVAGLVVVVRAIATPDRGLQRFVADLAQAAGATTWIALGHLEGLEARGDGAKHRRIDDWRNLAANAGASGGVLAWDAQRGTARALDLRNDAR
ncbi:uncharacterized protein DUF2868 [Panacagrimonas perspica]|uniref:Uncharacterized protein DUF2868 n=1 Tax=Panacagrimonas perspica TaxID=381431 RepID=A0A4S3K520_9GAMM|nr:DUF2868 domain-containing protein [Panacagrimonas perspica]TDU31580.1 uncharacterized protein DUF2868 [Panacagrimonas perspica]THD03190.1 hypothetical protein B1810_11495 [Panacagrimonas perspica]